uniref:Uncharacterized protein n=1 Tax=Setaria digitata TaxID=48799 RepID=A0A915PWQ5_9BILA
MTNDGFRRNNKFLCLGYSRALVNEDEFELDQYVNYECLQDGMNITLQLDGLWPEVKMNESMKLVLIGLNESRKCEMEVIGDSQPISMLVPNACLSDDTTQKDIISVADLNGESIEINSSVQIGFDLSLVIWSKRKLFRIVDCWTEQNNHRTNFLKNGIPERDSQAAPLCQLFDEISNYQYDSDNSNQIVSANQMRKMWQIRLRLAWDALPDSRQKALQQLLRTKPVLQWDAVPDLSIDINDFLSPITIYPIMIQCSLSPLSSKRTLVITSFGPIGVFIPQFYFLENTLFSCCPVEATVAYANRLHRSHQKKLFCSKVSTATALLVSVVAFAMAVCCSTIIFNIRHKNCGS